MYFADMWHWRRMFRSVGRAAPERASVEVAPVAVRAEKKMDEPPVPIDEIEREPVQLALF
jgi:hypothetical protein